MLLVGISAEEYGVDIDLRYATPANFTGARIYRRAACYLHPDTASVLGRASDLAGRLGFRLRIFDAFRPSEAQWVLWRHLPDRHHTSPTLYADHRTARGQQST